VEKRLKFKIQARQHAPPNNKEKKDGWVKQTHQLTPHKSKTKVGKKWNQVPRRYQKKEGLKEGPKFLKKRVR